jgi:hypothetical protein
MDNTPLILTGPPGCGKSYWIQDLAKKTERQLFVCPCRKDRTLRDGRQKLHIWARRTEPAILWLEGADDLTPEAQAFLRRILETHAPEIQFILECRDAGKLQEPIRSRCILKKLAAPDLSAEPFLDKNEYSFRRLQQIEFLKSNYPEIWENCKKHKEEERQVSKAGLVGDQIPTYIQKAYNPDNLLRPLLQGNIELLSKYGRCVEDSGSTWAFLGSVLAGKAAALATSTTVSATKGGE